MPSMFSRRRGSSANPPVDRNTQAAAAAAAGSAFLSSSQSNASLSSAAAAAALRSLTTTPEPVGSIQTKRMVRRGSVSSVGSGSVIGSSTRGGVGRGGLQRQNSGGSMTERTFRSPSPSSRINGAVSPAPDAPPVPALPKNLKAGNHQRASSLEAPQRIMSPGPRGGGRGSSLDRASLPAPAANRTSKRLSNVMEGPNEETERPNGASVNFSRPMSPGASPAGGGAKKYTHGTGSFFTSPAGSQDASRVRPKTSDGLPKNRSSTASNFAAQDIQNAANKPVTKKQRAVSGPQGSHLAQANREAEADDTVMVYDPNTRTFVSKRVEAPAEPRPAAQDSVMVYDANSRSFTPKPREPEPSSPTTTQPQTPTPGTWDPHTRRMVPSDGSNAPTKKQKPILTPVETKLEPPPRNPARLSPTSSTSPSSPRGMGLLHKQPSVVREDPEGEEAAARGAAYSSSTSARAVQPTGRTIQTSAGPAKAYIAPTKFHQRSSSLDIPRGGGTGDGRGRGNSLSPARSAHFSVSPVIEAIRHDPPPRSISPAKSAMKHGSSPASSLRNASPMAAFGLPGAKVAPSDAGSEAGESVTSSQDGGPKPKRRVRVSFDEQPQIVDAEGAAAAPRAIATAAPASTIRERSPAVDDEEFEEEMSKPRPALPSFGSVRRNRAVSPEIAEKVTEMPPEREGVSSDYGVGAVLANAHTQKKDHDAPLPPEVTSKDVAEYASDKSEEEGSFKPEAASTPAKPAESQPVVDDTQPKTRDFATETASRLAPHPAPELNNGDTVPSINLLPATPGEEEIKKLGESSPKPKASFEYVVPGGWAAEEESSENKVPTAQHHSAQPVQDIVQQPEPKSLFSETTQPQQPSPILHVVDEESDDSAAFSDAAEDLSDLEDGGFASLDAIVSSPYSPSSPSADKTKTVESLESPTKSAMAKKHAAARAGEGSGDWSQATAYWSQLSRKQREQIEREHLSSDDEARPVPAVTKKPKKKKSATAGSASATDPQASEVSMPRTMRNKPGPTPAGGDNEVHMRSSMRNKSGPAGAGAGAGAGDGEVHMRSSMRNKVGPSAAGPGDGEVHMRRSMRDGAPSQRPQSEHIASSRQAQPQRLMSSGGPGPSRLNAGGLPNRPRTATVDSQDSTNMPMPQDGAFPKMRQNRQPPQQIQPSPAKPAPASRNAPIAPSGAFTNKLQKQVSKGDDSDSESSFRKKRRPSASTVDSAGRYSMRRSMRAGSVDDRASVDMRPSSPTPGAAGKRGGGAFSIRSLSPSGGSVFGRGKGEKLRESLRSGSVDAAASGRRITLRSGPPPTNKGGRPATSSGPAPAQTKSRFRSRFADSDDEDDDRGGKSGFFSSRFADSDDDEPGSPRVMAADLTPVRGIPRRTGQDDGDSTDLSDEDDDPRKAGRRREKQVKPMLPDSAEIDKAMEAARKKLGMPAPGQVAPAQIDKTAHEGNQGSALGKGSLRKPAGSSPQAELKSKAEDAQTNGMPERRRRGFMGSILRRNRNSQMSVQQVESPMPASPAPASPAVATSTQNGESSPSSPLAGKLVRRGSQQPQPKMKRGDSSFSTATAPPTSSALRHKESSNWPLPPVPKINGDATDADRPNTSDGVNPEAIKLARTMRPDIGQRSQSNQVPRSRFESGGGHRVGFAEGSKEEDGDSGAVYSKRTGKKKRFQALRKAFKLND